MRGIIGDKVRTSQKTLQFVECNVLVKVHSETHAVHTKPRNVKQYELITMYSLSPYFLVDLSARASRFGAARSRPLYLRYILSERYLWMKIWQIILHSWSKEIRKTKNDHDLILLSTPQHSARTKTCPVRIIGYMIE